MDRPKRSDAAALRAVIAALVAAMLAIAIQSCSTVKNLSEGVPNPMTPDQSKAQVVNAAREIVATLRLKDVSGHFSRESCNDQAVAPFRGVVGLSYDHAPTLEASQAQIQQMIGVLKEHGWSAPSDFHSHSPAVTKQNVTAVFDPYSPVQDAGGSITLYGECRDMTTRQNAVPEPIPADQLA
ncbi:hypothetical protein [Mycobacterium sp. HUMS_1102779]|uniref:hypothetical protein n=1 Tax=Mycobacterium sp. HUMS_1102779 TaxID=3383487 RepID=UPI00389A49AC